MNCPVCSKEMLERNIGARLFVCDKGCKGIWLDHLELNKIDEKNEAVNHVLQEALNFPRVNDASRPALKCPKCNLFMHTHKSMRNKFVNIDECYGCGGFFLDSGELTEIRNNGMSDLEREEFVDRLAMNIENKNSDSLRNQAITALSNILSRKIY